MYSLRLMTCVLLMLLTLCETSEFECICNNDVAYNILPFPAPHKIGSLKPTEILAVAYTGDCFFYNGTYVTKNETFFKTDVNGKPGWFWYVGYEDPRIENCSNPIRDNKEGANCLYLMRDISLYGYPNKSEGNVIATMLSCRRPSECPRLLSVEPFTANNHSWYNVTYLDKMRGYAPADNPSVMRWQCGKSNDKIPVWEIAVITGVAIFLLLPFLLCVLYKRRLSELKWMNPSEEPYADTHTKAEYDVFISYSSADIEWIRDPLFTNLRNEGFRICIDFKDFMPGTDVSENIMNSIYRSRKTIVVMSNNFLGSVWGQFELQQALHKAIAQRKNTLIIIKYGKCKIPRRLMGKIFLDWTCENETQFFWKRLFESIGKPISETTKLL